MRNSNFELVPQKVDYGYGLLTLVDIYRQGPFLFLLYINDLPDNVQLSVRLFADDALLYGIVASDSDRDLLQSDLRRLESWQYHWQMEFNPSKCKIVTISHKNNPPQRKYVS